VSLRVFGGAPSSSPSSGEVPGPAYNVVPTNFHKWRKALAKVRTGQANARLLCAGDSTTAGATASTYLKSYPTLLRQLLNAYHVPAVDGGIWGRGGATVTDSRVSVGSGWTAGSATGGWGQGGWSSVQNASGTLSFTFAHSIDTIDVYYNQFSGGSVTVNVDGGASLGTINAPGFNIASKQTFTCPPGTHTINITGATGGPFYMAGVEAYLSTSKVVLVSNAGCSSSTSSNWATSGNAGSAYNQFAVYPPDLTLTSLGINDASGSVADTAYDANMRAIIAKAQVSGDVLHMPAIPSNGAGAVTEGFYRTKDRLMAADLGCGFLDIAGRWGSYAVSNPLGYYVDSTHPSDLGYSDWAQAAFNVVQSI
jgi:lysophospholipase L1-like esterase